MADHETADAAPAPPPFRVGVLLFHRVGDLECVGPIATLDAAKRFLDDPDRLEIATVARSRFSVQTAADLTLTPRWAFASAPRFDALVVPGGPGVDTALNDRALVDFLASRAGDAVVTAGVSSGVLLLGAAGLLRGRRATTHPDILERLEPFEVLEAVRARLVVGDDGVWSAGAPAAGVDVALTLLERRFGAPLAREAAGFVGHPFAPSDPVSRGEERAG